MANWDQIKSKGNVVDRRGVRPGVFASGGIGVLLISAAITYALGGNPLDVLLSPEGVSTASQYVKTDDVSQYEGADSYETFISQVLGSNNAYWENALPIAGTNYREPTLVLFRDTTTSACGGAASSIGPHYCPLDETIYLDERFFITLEERFGAEGGDVAEAYVVSHEVGHHIQNLLGRLSNDRSQSVAINTELTADCMAGMWLGSLKDQAILEPGEISEALSAAAAVGDDSIQQKTTGTIQPESWTHGSAAAREQAFTLGYQSGLLEQCLETYDTTS